MKHLSEHIPVIKHHVTEFLIILNVHYDPEFIFSYASIKAIYTIYFLNFIMLITKANYQK